MTDLVERLRQGVGNLPEDCMDAEKWMDKAADEIERLRKIELQFLALKEERPRWRADNEWLTQDNDRLRAFVIERLRQELDNCAQARAGWKRFCEAGNQAEIERLRGEVESWKALVRDYERRLERANDPTWPRDG